MDFRNNFKLFEKATVQVESATDGQTHNLGEFLLPMLQHRLVPHVKYAKWLGHWWLAPFGDEIQCHKVLINMGPVPWSIVEKNTASLVESRA